MVLIEILIHHVFFQPIKCHFTLNPCAAFSKDCLLNGRWLLGGCPKQVAGIWGSILEMNSAKQLIFLQRILFVHSLTKQKAGRAQVLRVAAQVWDVEADVSCLGGFVLEEMRQHRTPENLLRFPGETLITVMNQFIEGYLDTAGADWKKDYHEELKGALMVMDPAFRLEDLNMWKENIPNASTLSDGQLCKADDKIDELILSQNKLSFEADALALARDAAQLATLYREEQKTDRGARLAKVLHLKQQNQIGSSLTMDFMRKRRVEDKFSAKQLEPTPIFVRALSPLQEQAQLLTGPSLPESLISSLLQGSTAGPNIGLINMSPYDGCLEKVAMRFCANATTVQEALVPHEEASEAEPAPVKSWGEDEPKNLDSLLDTHIIENKIGGRVAGTSLYLTLAKKRDGTETGVVSHQDDVTLSEKEFQIAHGKSSFMKPERVVSPRGSDPGKGPKPAAKQPALPLNSFNATGKDKKAQLSPEQVADLRADISGAMGNVGKLRRQKTAADPEGAADALASEPVKPNSTKQPRAPRGTYARKAAQAVLDSLVTPATKPSESKGKGESVRGRPAAKAKAKGKAKSEPKQGSSGSKPSKGAALKKPSAKTTAKAAAKKARRAPRRSRMTMTSLRTDDKLEAEDLFGSDSEMATTQELPGLGEEDEEEEHGGESQDEGGEDSQCADDGSSEGGSNRKTDSENSSPNLRTLYWNVVHEQQKQIKKSNPEMPGREVLKWETHPQRMNVIKNLPKSEVMVTAKTDVPQPVTPKPNRLQKVKRAMTLVMNREVSSPRAAPQRPSTVTGAERGVTSQGGTVRLADFTQPNPRRRVRPLKSSFSLWNDKKTKEVQEQTQTAQKKQSTKKAEVSLQFSSRQAMPLSVTRRESTKIVTDLAELRRIFDFYDKDGSDLIDPEEFVPLLTRVLKRPSNSMDKKEIWQIWDNIDQDGSGQISFDEFQQWYCKAFRIDGNPDRTSFISSEQVPPHEGMIRNIAKKLNLDFFKVDSLWTRYSSFDLDKSGALDYQEFTRLIQRELSPAGSPESVPDKVVQKFWIEIDTDKSGLVSFGEFCAWYMKFLFGGKSPMEQYYAAFSSRGSGPRPTLIRSETVKSSKDGK
eukprot:s2929_g6.t1